MSDLAVSELAEERGRTMAEERWGIWLVSLAWTRTTVGSWLRSYDLDAHHGRGEIVGTQDAAQAMAFPSFRACLEAWHQISPTYPVRADGKPNKPLTGFTIEPRRLPGGDA